MILAGSDVSGNTVGGGQHRHIAFLVGKEESINTIYNKIGLKEIHMVRLTDTQKENVYRLLDFSTNDILAWCFHVEKQNTVDYIQNHEKLHPKTKSRESIHKRFDHLLLKEFREKLESFCSQNRISITDLQVECETDMAYTIDNWRMKKKSRGRAYEISDAIAYFNEKARKIRGCGDIDLRDKLRKQMESELLK